MAHYCAMLLSAVQNLPAVEHVEKGYFAENFVAQEFVGADCKDLTFDNMFLSKVRNWQQLSAKTQTPSISDTSPKT